MRTYDPSINPLQPAERAFGHHHNLVLFGKMAFISRTETCKNTVLSRMVKALGAYLRPPAGQGSDHGHQRSDQGASIYTGGACGSHGACGVLIGAGKIKFIL